MNQGGFMHDSDRIDSYAITGASGFVGSFLIGHFLRRGKVLGITRTAPGLGSARCSFLQADITTGIPNAPAFAGSAMIHTAAVMKRVDAATFHKVNVDGTIAALDWAIRHEARHFVLFSSGGVYGYSANPLREDDPLKPIGDYGESKKKAEEAAEHYHQRYGLPVTVVRLFFPYGPGQTRGIFPTIAKAVRQGRPLTIHEGGSPRINPVHRADIASAVERLLDCPDGFRVINVCGDEEVSFLDLVRRAESRQGRPAVLEYSREAHGDLLGDNARLKSLGWTPTTRGSPRLDAHGGPQARRSPDDERGTRMDQLPNITGSHVFISGGAGFIGTALAARLAGSNRVTLYDNLHNNALANTRLSELSNVEFVEGDVCDLRRLLEAMSGGVNYVIHCAAIAGVDTVLQNPLQTLEVNLLGTRNMLEACAGLPALQRFVSLSTSEVYGRHAAHVQEDVVRPEITVGEPRWTYAISKLAGEFFTDAYRHVYQVPTVTVRPFNVYGPNQVGIGAIHQFVLRALADEDIVIHNDGSQVRAWCYIDDFVEGTLRAMAGAPQPGRCYNIGNPDAGLTVAELAHLIVREAGTESRLVFKQLDYPDVEVRIPDIASARAELGFTPQVDINEGVRRTIAWYRQRLGKQCNRQATVAA
jgi:nucleoside-diphosphate-sugar epimerase